MALAGLGAFVAIRWCLRLEGAKLVAGVLGVVVIVGCDRVGPQRWIVEPLGERQEPMGDQGVRASLAAVHEVVADAGPRPSVLVMNYNDTDDETGTNTAYGWVKTYTNVFRTGIPGDMVKYNATYLGTAERFLAGRQTTGVSEGYNDASQKHFEELQSRLKDYPQAPVVFLIGQYYKGLCNGETDCTDQVEQERLRSALENAIEVGPDTYLLQGDGLYAPPQEVVDRAEAAAVAEQTRLENHPSAAANPLHTIRVLIGLFFLAFLPGLIAAPWFGLRDAPSRVALIPGMSIVLTLLSGIVVLAIWRGPLTTTKAWVVVALAALVALGLRLGSERLNRVLGSFGGFFNNLFSVFSNRAYATLVGVQFLVQAGQGVIQGAFAKSIAFGGEKGFDVTVVPSAQYLLKVVLALYVPYTLVSPFIGVGIDRFERRRILSLSNIVTAVVVSIVAVAVMLPLGKETSEGNVGATVALIIGLLFIQGCTRVALAVKSAAIPDVLSGKDLLQGNGLSQAAGRSSR